jgi:hypothetical protein
MLEDLHPEIQLETTISNPMDYAQVIGFHGRDVKLGNDAVIIKEEFVQDGKFSSRWTSRWVGQR